MDTPEPKSIADEIAKLAALKNDGHLTEEEFQDQKRRLLGSNTTLNNQQTQPINQPPLPSPAVKRHAGNSTGPVLITVIVAVVALAILSQCGKPKVSPSPSWTDPNAVVSTSNVAPKWSPPDGFSSAVTTNGVPFGYRWLKSKEFSCKYEDVCWGMELVSSQDCPQQFYAQISLLDKEGTNIGWTNDTVQSLGADRKAKLIFGSYETSAHTAELGETECQ